MTYFASKHLITWREIKYLKPVRDALYGNNMGYSPCSLFYQTVCQQHLVHKRNAQVHGRNAWYFNYLIWENKSM